MNKLSISSPTNLVLASITSILDQMLRLKATLFGFSFLTLLPLLFFFLFLPYTLQQICCTTIVIFLSLRLSVYFFEVPDWLVLFSSAAAALPSSLWFLHRFCSPFLSYLSYNFQVRHQCSKLPGSVILQIDSLTWINSWFPSIDFYRLQSARDTLPTPLRFMFGSCFRIGFWLRVFLWILQWCCQNLVWVHSTLPTASIRLSSWVFSVRLWNFRLRFADKSRWFLSILYFTSMTTLGL